MNSKIQIHNSTAEFLIFTNQAKEDGVEVRIQGDTIWLSQKLMAVLFDCTADNISLHLKNIFKEGELDENSTTEFFSVVATNGKTYSIKHYNLDAIIAVGYRINSKRATAFRANYGMSPLEYRKRKIAISADGKPDRTVNVKGLCERE